MHGKNLIQTKMGEENLIKLVEICLVNERNLMIEMEGEEIRSQLYPIVTKQFFKKDNQNFITLNSMEIEVPPSFKIYLLTKQNYPRISPLMYTVFSVINFSLTISGLEEQFLGYIVES